MSTPRLLAVAVAAGFAFSLPLPQALAEPVAPLEWQLDAGPLEATLPAFAARAGVPLSFDPARVAGLRSPALRGRLTVEQGFARLLAGSGLVAVRQPDGGYALRERGEAVLAPVKVRGATEAGQASEYTGAYGVRAASTATRMNLSPRQTPQSMTVITRQRMDDQNLASVGAVLDQAPGIHRLQYGADGTSNSTYYARGFAIENYQLDGALTPAAALQGLSSGVGGMDSALYDRIEVVRGATGLLTGSGNPGATVNLVRKKPGAEPAAHITVSAGSWDRYRGELDVSAPLSEGGGLRARAVLVREDRRSWMDRYHAEATVFYGVLEADLTERTLLTVGLDAHKSSVDGGTYTGYEMLDATGQRTYFSRSSNSGARWAYNDVERYNLFATLAHHFANDWQATLSLTRGKTDTEERIGDVGWGIDPATGSANASAYFYGWSPTQDGVDFFANGPYQLFGREHELMAGINYYRIERDDPAYGVISMTVDDIYGYRGDLPLPVFQRTGDDVQTTRQLGGYLATRLRPTDRLSVIAGARVTDWERDSRSPSSVQALKETGEVTPYLGVVFDIARDYSLYASYATVFNPQTVQDQLGRTLEPEEGVNYEAGVKGELQEGRLNLSAAVFEVRKDNLAVRDGTATTPTGGRAYRAENDTRARGYEVEITGELAEDWNLSAGYTRVVTRDHAGDRINPDQPKHLFKLFTAYRLPGDWHRLTLGGGLTWQSGVRFPAEPARYQRAYTLYSLMARYQATDRLSFALNLENLTDKTYLRTIWNHAYGAPRNATVQARYDF